jgi:hypothetical protein
MKAFIFMRIHPNHSVQIHIGLASSKRHKCNNAEMTGETASADTVEAEKFFTAL